MADTTKELSPVDQFRTELFTAHQKSISNYFNGDKNEVMRFMTSVVYSIQKTPKLLECDRVSLMNSFMLCAQFKLYPSSAGGEAFVIPYAGKAQFQLGYPGLATLLYRAGNRAVNSEIVREHDTFSFVNGKIHHEIDPRKSREQRGEAIGAYAIITTSEGGEILKYMPAVDIIDHAKRFSQSYFEYDYKTKKPTDKISPHTPWNPENDPELWMWRKTVLKQGAKLAPRNESLNQALEEDNKESRISQAKELAAQSDLRMGNLMQPHNDQESKGVETPKTPPAESSTT